MLAYFLLVFPVLNILLLLILLSIETNFSPNYFLIFISLRSQITTNLQQFTTFCCNKVATAWLVLRPEPSWSINLHSFSNNGPVANWCCRRRKKMKTAADTEVKGGGVHQTIYVPPARYRMRKWKHWLRERERGTERLEPAASFSQSCTMIFPLCWSVDAKVHTGSRPFRLGVCVQVLSQFKMSSIVFAGIGHKLQCMESCTLEKGGKRLNKLVCLSVCVFGRLDWE